jgi:hypothetical protein
MIPIDTIPYAGLLPDSFFSIPAKIYKDLPFKPAEESAVVTTLFAMEAERNEIVIYTNHTNVRLTGIFPVNEPVAYFGFWETVDDVALHRQAFALLEADARKRNKTTLVGPVNFNTYHNYRLRLGAVPGWNMFDREPVNPGYYPLLLQQSDFNAKATFESRLIRIKNIPDVYIDKAVLLNELSKIPFDFIPLNEGNWQLYEEQIFELVDAIFSENPLYKTISANQFKLLYNHTFSRKLCPYSSVIFRDQSSGVLAAISMCHPNYHSLSPAATELNFKDDFERLDKKVLLAKTVGVHPDFRQQGLMNYMGAYGMLSFRDRYDEVIFCLMRSDNYSLHFTDSVAYEAAKYVLYEKSLY